MFAKSKIFYTDTFGNLSNVYNSSSSFEKLKTLCVYRRKHF